MPALIELRFKPYVVCTYKFVEGFVLLTAVWFSVLVIVASHTAVGISLDVIVT